MLVVTYSFSMYLDMRIVFRNPSLLTGVLLGVLARSDTLPTSSEIINNNTRKGTRPTHAANLNVLRSLGPILYKMKPCETADKK